MRTVKAAAIQPNYISAVKPYNALQEGYDNNVDGIIEHYVRQQLEVTLSLVRCAGVQNCDLTVTSEDITGLMDYEVDVTSQNVFSELVRRTAPIAERELSQLARQYSMNIVACYFKEYDGSVFNVASVFDRNGEICGEYRKTHLPPNEKWQCRAGDALEPVELDFGKIGICVCYDMMFPAVIETLALKGAEIITHPTLNYGWYDEIGETTLRTRANDNSVHIVTSKNYDFNRAGKSSIVDFWGHIRADAGYYENMITVHEIDLDCKKTQPVWYNPTRTGGDITDVKERKLMERRPELYAEICAPKKRELAMPSLSEERIIFEEIKQRICRW